MTSWTSTSGSEFPLERDTLVFIRNGLPSSSPIQAWSNFEFIADGGAIYEVDTLLVGPWGPFLVEIKSIPGVVSSRAGSWIWRDGTTYKTRDNPLPLANRKYQALRSLLERQAAFKKGEVQVPFMPGVLETLRNSNEDILLTDAGLSARYGRVNELDALRNDTGIQSGPHSLWLLVPGHGATTTPPLRGQAVPITNEAQFEQLTPQWARNFHRGGVV